VTAMSRDSSGWWSLDGHDADEVIVDERSTRTRVHVNPGRTTLVAAKLRCSELGRRVRAARIITNITTIEDLAAVIDCDRFGVKVLRRID
jgi:hypothetical protein